MVSYWWLIDIAKIQRTKCKAHSSNDTVASAGSAALLKLDEARSLVLLLVGNDTVATARPTMGFKFLLDGGILRDRGSEGGRRGDGDEGIHLNDVV